MDQRGGQRPKPPEPGPAVLSPDRMVAAQNGARAWVGQAAAVSARGLGWVTPRALLAGLCASALAPLAVVEPDPEAAVAGILVLGSVGANLLSDVIGASLIAARARTRSNIQADPPPLSDGPSDADSEEAAAELAGRIQQVEQELAARLEEILHSDDARAQALAETLAVVLGELQVTQVVITEAVASGDERLLEEMVAGFAALGEQTAALTPMLGRLDAAAGRIQQTLYRQDAEHRFDRTQRQRQEALLVVMREQLSEKLTALERRLRTEPGPLPETEIQDRGRWRWRRRGGVSDGVSISGAGAAVFQAGRDGQQRVGDHADQAPSVPGGPAGDLSLVQPGQALGGLEVLLDPPSATHHAYQFVQWLGRG